MAGGALAPQSLSGAQGLRRGADAGAGAEGYGLSERRPGWVWGDATTHYRGPDGETFLTKNVDAAILGVTLELKGRGHDGPLARCAGRTGARSAPECRAGHRRQRPVPDLLSDERDAVLSVHHAATTLSRRLRCPPIAVYIHTPSDRNDRAGYGETVSTQDAPAGWEISFLASALGPDELGLST